MDKISFIPKKPLATRSSFIVNVSGVFLFVSFVILILSVGWYFIAISQQSSKKKEVDNLKVSLEKAQEQFQPNQVINMTRFDTKMKVAKNLLYLSKDVDSIDNVEHITLRPLFKVISDKTLKSVRFRDFKYTNIDNQKINIKMSGEARSVGNVANYAAVAQQARELSDTRVLTNVIVSDLNLGANNNVVFNISASVRPDLLSYTECLNNDCLK